MLFHKMVTEEKQVVIICSQNGTESKRLRIGFDDDVIIVNLALNRRYQRFAEEAGAALFVGLGIDQLKRPIFRLGIAFLPDFSFEISAVSRLFYAEFEVIPLIGIP